MSARPPPLPTSDAEEAVMLLTFAVRELTSELAQFRRFSEQAENVSVPSAHYTKVDGASSWREMGQRRVSLVSALVWGGLGCLALELVRLMITR